MNVQDTSTQAYHEDVKPTLNARQNVIIQALRHKDQVTNNELAYTLGWPINTVTPRIFELREMGLVIEHCRRPDKNTRRRSICW